MHAVTLVVMHLRDRRVDGNLVEVGPAQSGDLCVDVRMDPPTLSDPFSSVTGLAPTIGSAGETDTPSGGASAVSGSYSSALFGLNGKADATSCVPAAFSATMSPAADASGSLGPLTVARLFRRVLLSLPVLEGRDVFAIGAH